MTFERYMALSLYHPEFGYYTQGRERTGVGGDYFTSADLHPVFARLLARQAASPRSPDQPRNSHIKHLFASWDRSHL